MKTSELRSSNTHPFSVVSAWRRKGLPARSAVARSAIVTKADAGHSSALPPVLELYRRECLLQARIGFGERGRGLFFAPAPPAAADSAEAPTLDSVSAAATAGALPHPQQQQQWHVERGQPQPEQVLPPQLRQQHQHQQREEERGELVRVPLRCGLALVTGGGPVWLQRELLSEWQSYPGCELPGQLTALLEDTQRPPALRLAAWLLWSTQVATPREDGGATGGDVRGEATPSGPPAASSSASSCNPIATAAVAPAGPSGPQPAPPPAPPRTSPAGVHLMSEYARHVMPPVGAGASCLRLADGEVRRLPANARAALRDVRGQVSSYVSELRRLGLDWGLSDATLWWAFDMVASRSFAASAPLPPPPTSATLSGGGSASLAPSPLAPFPPGPTGASDVSLALYLPWACLLNHSPSPNAHFSVDVGRRVFRVEPRRCYTSSLPYCHSASSNPDSAPTATTLPFPPGSELCVSYGDDLDNVQLLIKYGFCTAGNPNDRLPLPPELAAAARGLRRQALCSAAEQLADGLPRAVDAAADVGPEGSPEQRRTRVFAALASLLQPTVLPAGATSVSGAGQAMSGLEGLLFWSESTAGNPVPGDCATEASSTIPASAQLLSCACVDSLLEEQRLLTESVHKLLANYGRIAAAWG